MGQQEVHDILKELRKESSKWYTVGEIKQAMLTKGYTENYLRGVTDDLFRLATFNFIKFRGVGGWNHHKEFKAYATDVPRKERSAKKL
jgi:hypothetical protein